MFARRLHVSFKSPDRGLRAAECIAPIVAVVLGWDAGTVARELDRYRRRVRAEREAAEQPDDASADAVGRRVRDPRLATARARR